MEDVDLARALKKLRRTVLMLQTELRHEHLDEVLLAEIESQMEAGISTDARGMHLRDQVDRLRENTLIPRSELFADCIKACERLMDAIQAIMESLR